MYDLHNRQGHSSLPNFKFFLWKEIMNQFLYILLVQIFWKFLELDEKLY